jgi:hypothetical protein
MEIIVKRNEFSLRDRPRAFAPRDGIQFARRWSVEPFQWRLNCRLHYRRLRSIVVEIMLSIAENLRDASTFSPPLLALRVVMRVNGSIQIVECEVMNPLSDDVPLNHVGREA